MENNMDLNSPAEKNQTLCVEEVEKFPKEEERFADAVENEFEKTEGKGSDEKKLIEAVSAKRMSQRKGFQLTKEKMEKLNEDVYEWEYPEQSGRGRPRKIKVLGMNDSSAAVDEIVYESENPDKPKRGRGRPRKIKDVGVNQCSVVVESLHVSENPEKPKWGVDESLYELENPEKPNRGRGRGRGRGRPRKIKDVGVNQSSVVDESLHESENPEKPKSGVNGCIVVDEPENPEKPKSGMNGCIVVYDSLFKSENPNKPKRGRPKKIKGVGGGDGSVVDEFESKNPKKPKRGRPRKLKGLGVNDGSGVNESVCESKNPEKPKRGRPKKIKGVGENDGSVVDESVGEKRSRKRRRRRKLSKNGEHEEEEGEPDKYKVPESRDVKYSLKTESEKQENKSNRRGRKKLYDENGKEIEPNTCHQCKRNDKGRVVRCSKCKSRRYCIPCITRWYPRMPEEDFAKACPVCLKNCNCKGCLRLDGSFKRLKNLEVQFIDEEKMKYSRYILQMLLPFLRRFHAEEMAEKEREAKMRVCLSRNTGFRSKPTTVKLPGE